MQFEFDETGGSFYYFLVSFYFLLLLPISYFFWPKNDGSDSQELNRRKCRCDPCQSKQHFISALSPNKNRRRKLIQAAFLLAWAVFLILSYKVSQIEMEWNEFDPFSELGVSKDATPVEIRGAYKKMSLKYHPDKGGDPKRFIRLTKAYAALTNEQSRKNWQEHGNPDGPGATQFGIALPKWIVEKKNSIWVLGAYVFVFMVVLPMTVGFWWYRTIKFNSDKILLNTTQLYFFFFNRTPNMPLKRVLMILSSSFEFNKANNSEIVERPSDNQELPALLKHFPQINIKIKEMPFAAVYSVKARVLIYSHLHRLGLPIHTLHCDKNVIIRKCPYLINEMINIVAQLVAIGHQDAGINVPRLDTVEFCMKLSQMVIQAVTENQSPMMQLPHITEDMLRHFVTRKRNVRSIRTLVELKEDDRRSLLRSFSDDQYRDLMVVCANMPLITMECHCEVRDEDDSTITPCSIVTVTVRLTRKPLGTLFPPDFGSSVGAANSGSSGSSTGGNKWQLSPASNAGFILATDSTTSGAGDRLYSGVAIDNGSVQAEATYEDDDEQDGVKNDGGALDDDAVDQEKSQLKKKPVWEKNRSKKKSNVKASKAKNKKVKVLTQSKPNGKVGNQVAIPEEKGLVKSEVNQNDDVENSDNESGGTVGMIENEEEHSNTEEVNDNNSSPKFDEEDKWQRFQEEARRENSLETKARTTHQVHCPHFLAEKYEWWWVYLSDRRAHNLVSAPLQLCSLQDHEELQLKFTAPATPGQYVYTVNLRSDSYIDFDQCENVKITVKEAKEIDYVAQWRISDEENSESDEDDDEEDNENGNKKRRKQKARRKEKQRKQRDLNANNKHGSEDDSEEAGGSDGEDDGLTSNTDYDYDD